MTVYIIGDSTTAHHSTRDHHQKLFDDMQLKHLCEIRSVDGASVGHYTNHFYKQLQDLPDGSSIFIVGGWNDFEGGLLKWLPMTIELIKKKRLNVLGRTALVCDLVEESELSELLREDTDEWTKSNNIWSDLFDAEFKCLVWADFVTWYYRCPKANEIDEHHRLWTREMVAFLDYVLGLKDPRRTYQEGSEEYQRRIALFQEHLAAVREKNARQAAGGRRA